MIFFSVDESAKQPLRKLNISEIEPTLKAALTKFTTVGINSKGKYFAEKHSLKNYEEIIMAYQNRSLLKEI